MKQFSHTFLLLCLMTNVAFAEIVVTDDRGRDIKLAAPAQRIISLAPFLTENLFAIGAGEQVIATDSASDYPLSVKKLERVGNHQMLNLEKILSLKPDLIVIWDSGYQGRALQQLEFSGVPVYYSEPKNLKQVASTLRRLGILSGQHQHAEKIASDYELKLASFSSDQYKNKTVAVFFQICDGR